MAASSHRLIFIEPRGLHRDAGQHVGNVSRARTRERSKNEREREREMEGGIGSKSERVDVRKREERHDMLVHGCTEREEAHRAIKRL